MDNQDYYEDDGYQEEDEVDETCPGFFQRLKGRLSFRHRGEDPLDEPQPLVGAADTENRRLYERIEARRMGCVCVHMLADSIAEAERAVQNLKEGRQVIVNVEGVGPAMARRVVDIVNGASYALGGYRRQIGEGVFLYTPPNVYIVVESLDDLESPPYGRRPDDRGSRYDDEGRDR